MVDKSNGKFREIKNFGVAKTDAELETLFFKAKQWIREYGGLQEIILPSQTKNQQRKRKRTVYCPTLIIFSSTDIGLFLTKCTTASASTKYKTPYSAALS